MVIIVVVVSGDLKNYINKWTCAGVVVYSLRRRRRERIFVKTATTNNNNMKCGYKCVCVDWLILWLDEWVRKDEWLIEWVGE